jgi:hypothetical protein
MHNAQKIAEGARLWKAFRATGGRMGPELTAWLSWKKSATAYEIETAQFDAEFQED